MGPKLLSANFSGKAAATVHPYYQERVKTVGEASGRALPLAGMSVDTWPTSAANGSRFDVSV